MEITFQTKEQSNKARQKAFLNLSKAERFYTFLQLMERIKKFPTKTVKSKSSNFVIEISE